MDFGYTAEQYAPDLALVKEHGLESVTNLIVRRPFGAGGKTIALNAHGDVVPPGEGWTHDPYGGDIVDGKMYGRATAVSKCDFSTFTFAVRAVEALASKSALKGTVELHFTYDEEFGGALGPDYLLANNLTKPDLMIAAGFSYQVVTAHNGCLQMEVTVNGNMAHAAIPESGVDALQGANQILTALYAQNDIYKQVTSLVEGITHPYLNVGMIAGGTNTNVVPGKVVMKVDRRMIPEENPSHVEANLHKVMQDAVDSFNTGRTAVQRHETLGRQQAFGGRPVNTWRSRVWRTHSRIGHAALHRCTFVCGARHSRRYLRCWTAHRFRVACQTS